MKRFIDLGDQILEGGRQFAWFNTVIDCFEEHSGEQVWATWAEFERDFMGTDLPRYHRLFPTNWPKINGGGDG